MQLRRGEVIRVNLNPTQSREQVGIQDNHADASQSSAATGS